MKLLGFFSSTDFNQVSILLEVPGKRKRLNEKLEVRENQKRARNGIRAKERTALGEVNAREEKKLAKTCVKRARKGNTREPTSPQKAGSVQEVKKQEKREKIDKKILAVVHWPERKGD